MKKSSFNLSRQNRKLESRIVVALERVSEAFRVLLWNESKEHSLSPIQIQILIFIYFHSPEKCKVGYLANEFNMTKATVSDSVKVLSSKGLLVKVDDNADSRSQNLVLTPSGKRIAEKSSLFANAMEDTLEKLSGEQKMEMLNGLLSIIYNLNNSGIITIQRMCFTCSNYRKTDQEHFCALLDSKLKNEQLRVDCPEHQFIG